MATMRDPALPGAAVPTQQGFAVVQHAANRVAVYKLTPSFLVHDAGTSRLYLGGVAAGRRAGLIAISLETGTVKPLAVGSAAALAIDIDDNKIFVALAGLPQIEVLDRKSLQRIDRILLNDPAGTLVYDSHDHVLVAGAARLAVAWIVDARQHVVVDSVVLSGIAASSVFDQQARRAYLSVASADAVDAVDPLTRSVAELWQLTSSFSPQADVMLASPREVVVAGAHGAMTSIDPDTGKSIGTMSLPLGQGSIFADAPSRRVVFVSAVSGVAGVYSDAVSSALVLMGTFTMPAGQSAGVIVPGLGGASDLYVSGTNGEGTYLQRFTLPAR